MSPPREARVNMQRTQRKQKIQVFAVIRIDRDQWTDDAITITEIVPTIDQAVKEVERLNRLNKSKGARYFWQATRYFPEGRAL